MRIRYDKAGYTFSVEVVVVTRGLEVPTSWVDIVPVVDEKGSSNIAISKLIT